MLFRFGGIIGLLLLVFWIYCVLDVIAIDGALMKHLPKNMWLILVIILPDVGGVAWLVLGRPDNAGWRPGDTEYRRPFSTRFVVRGPDDDPDFVRQIDESERSSRRAIEPPRDDEHDAKHAELQAREAELKKRELEAWEEDLLRREKELGRDDDNDPPA